MIRANSSSFRTPTTFRSACIVHQIAAHDAVAARGRRMVHDSGNQADNPQLAPEIVRSLRLRLAGQQALSSSGNWRQLVPRASWAVL